MPATQPLHPVTERGVPVAHKQLRDLDALISVATKARAVAAAGGLWDREPAGLALLNALYDLTEIDAVYDFRVDIERSMPAECVA